MLGFAGISHRRVSQLTAAVLVIVSLMSVLNGVWFTPVLMGVFILEISTLGGTEKTEYEQRLRQWRVSSPARWGLLSGAALILAAAMIASRTLPGGCSSSFGGWVMASGQRHRQEHGATSRQH